MNLNKEEKKIFILKNIDKANISLEDAQFLLDNGKLHICVNRIYYSYFYIVSALGIMNDFYTSRHKQLMGWFNKTYIHEQKVFENEFSRAYMMAYENRTDADYAVFSEFEPNFVENLLIKSKVIMKEIENYIRKNIS